MKRMFTTLLTAVLITSCTDENPPPQEERTIDYRAEMRQFVIEISNYAKSKQSGFLIVPQNGQELITDIGDASGSLQTEYLSAIDGAGREDMYYGYYSDDMATPKEDVLYLEELSLLCEANGVEILTTDYCFTPEKMEDSYQRNEKNRFISFAAESRNLDVIPHWPVNPHNENAKDIRFISDAKNFLYLINSERFSSKEMFIQSVSETNYDLIIMDAYHNGSAYNSEEIAQLRKKRNGGTRLILSYMSIGEAEEYRDYWNPDWSIGNPLWLEREDPHWKGNFYVRYWDRNWKSIIYGKPEAYLDRIIDRGFDGVYLDLIDAFEYFEGQIF